jgi:hypothetical protein
MSTRIVLYYDVVSPWVRLARSHISQTMLTPETQSYLAYVILDRYRKVWDLDLQLRPVFLGGTPDFQVLYVLHALKFESTKVS